MRKKIRIPYSKERVLLSDVLPYETPITFSNRHFYNYVIKRKKAIRNSNFKKNHCKAFKEIERILFSVDNETIPFSFNISHKKNDYRELNIIHPKNQVKVCLFYNTFNQLIIFYCNKSPFSIRKPSKVADFFFFDDLLHKKNKDGELIHSKIEQDENEYENLKSYFSYYKYSNIHRFYESYTFHRAEKKYKKLLKIDISKCFDNIYTHTISWAVLNKSIVKDNIDLSRKTFPGEFDYLLQSLNKNETNGIIIGPEFSRIFAEIILQEIDYRLLQALKKQDENGVKLIHRIDYEIYRYVDDCFVFCNSESDITRILTELKLILKEYKLYINENKSITYEKPIITEISIAKQKISDLFNNHLIFKTNKSKKGKVNEIVKSIEKFHNSLSEEKKEEYKLIANIFDYLKAYTKNDIEFSTDDSDENFDSMYFSSSNVITRFKTIIKESKIEYKDIMNYSLAILDKKTKNLLKKFNADNKGDTTNIKHYEKGILQILDVAFFLFSVTPRVNFTIKLSLILEKIISFSKKNKTNNYKEPFPVNIKHNIFKKISDEISLILERHKSRNDTEIETLYLLVVLSQLGREYRLNFKTLCSYFNIKIGGDNSLSRRKPLNYFSITVLLFYVKDIKAYKGIRKWIKEELKEKFKVAEFNPNWKRDTELIFLLLDILSCPFLNIKITKKEKTRILDLLKELHLLIIKPVLNPDKYIEEIEQCYSKIYEEKCLEKIDPRCISKVQNCILLYKEEFMKSRGYDVYKREEELVNSIQFVMNNVMKVVNKYKFKKEILNLVKITSNQRNLIEQERFWFTKWTEFDLGLELQAKRSQEVY